MRVFMCMLVFAFEGLVIVVGQNDVYDCVPNGSCETASGGIDPRIVTPSDGTSSACPTGYVRCNFKCGLSPIAPTTADGQSVKGSFPWQAYIYLNDNLLTYIGSGLLIDHYHVLTAAHKVNESKASIRVAFGVYNPRDSTEASTIQVKRAQIIAKHNLYNPTTLKNDIAIIRLDTPVNFNNNNVKPGCLPASAATSYVGQSCTVAGWGKTAFESSDSPTPYKKQVTVPIVAAATCLASMSNSAVLGSGAANYLDGVSEVCAGGVDKKDACTFDGGAPLECLQNGYYSTAGLAIWGKNCGQPNVYGVYVSVPYFLAWINTVRSCFLSGQTTTCASGTVKIE